MLIASDVTKDFSGNRILGPLSFSVNQGDRIALLGESGSGKSTLLAILSCLERPTSGEVVFDGVALHELGDRGAAEIRLRKMGFVHQFFDLLGELSAFENVMVPLWLRGERSGGERAKGLFRRLGLAGKEAVPAHLLSGGEQQRVAMARALVGEPRIVFADEATGSLDAETGARVLDLLLEEVNRLGATLVFATHSDRVASRFEKHWILRDGRFLGP